MAWPIALLALLVGVGLWTPRGRDRRMLFALMAVAIVLALIYIGLGSPPPASVYQ